MREILGPPTQAERQLIRRSSIRFASFLAVFMFVTTIVSRVGLFRRLPLLQFYAPGALTPSWMGVQFGLSVLTGVIAGFLWSKMIRFPHKSGADVRPEQR
jgi:ABC-type antimicrobial peptide transport system permease subunit